MNNEKLVRMMEIAMMAALAMVFDSIVIFTAPQGGSVSLVMLPIFLIAFRRGIKDGLMTGFLLGVLQIIFKVYYVHPMQVLLDYIVAFSGLGLAGIFTSAVKKNIMNGQKKQGIMYLLMGAFVGSAVRFSAHFLAGIIFYGAFAPVGTPVAMYSLIYNAWYMVPSFIISAFALSILVATAPLVINVRKKRGYSL